LQNPTLGSSDQVYLGGVNSRALLFFCLLVFGNTETEVARMFPIKGFADPGFHTFGLGVFDQHADPSRSLQNRPVTAD
jgi:hypothetical protein